MMVLQCNLKRKKKRINESNHIQN